MMCFGLKDRKRLKTNHCVIVLLDDTQLVHELHPSSSGQDLLDVVIKHLNLLETSYFGLKYYPDGQCNARGQYAPVAPSGQRRQPVWLDMERGAIKQLREVSPMTVHFGVKYYATDPCKLAEEITRYQFFLQCKQDILGGRLPVSFELAVELFGLAIQSELGDYDPGRHLENYASEFQFVGQQTLELEQRAALYHRQLTGQVPATAELNFLERVKWLDLYGCQLHQIQYDDGDPASGDVYALGLNPSGVLVLRNHTRVAQYLWARIVKTKCQGRCFLMDVIEAGPSDQPNNGLLTTAGAAKRAPPAKRNRFGFRLLDKEASRRLRWAIEEHKHFYHLIHSTATLNQLARQQRQQQHHHQQQQQQQAAAAAAAIANEQLKLSQRFRNSIRSAINLGAHANFLQHQQHQAQLAFQHQQQRLRSSVKSLNYDQSRPPPAVVRTPSRRYSNRSLPRPYNEQQQRRQQQALGGRPALLSHANGNGLPMVVGMSRTMMPDQRQQAMLMMANNQFGLPASLHHDQLGKSQTLRPVSSKEAKQRGYYQMLLAGDQGRPEVAILPPGQHIVQPSVYRATSVVDGINQLADVKRQQHQHQLVRPTMMQQFFSTRPRHGHRSGHESPRSTKSAMAPSSALKLASKKLAKQQQQLLYGAQAADVRPLLGYGGESLGQPADQLYYSNVAAYYSLTGAYSASASPRSVRNQALSRSKSTGENLHLAHKQQASAMRANSKMLLTTAAPHPAQLLPAHILPPPDYNSCNETGPRPGDARRKSAGVSERAARRRSSQEENDYYCSRSDCSSADDDGLGKSRQARLINGRLVHAAPASNSLRPEQARGANWLANITNQSSPLSLGAQQKLRSVADPNNNSNSHNHNHNHNNSASATTKNIANKQATPILLSIGQHFDSLQSSADHTKTNSKAVQLLNMQRQHLQASGGQSPPEDANRTAATSSASGSASSSVASSPHLPASGAQQQQQQTSLRERSFNQRRRHTAADSTGSSSTTTSGYYAGSNSTEPASVDSDAVSADCGPPATEKGRPAYGPDGEQRESTRVQMALGLHGPNARRLAAGPKTGYSSGGNGAQPRGRHEQQLFYLGESNSDVGRQQKDSPQQAQWDQSNGPASLKYVSFDV